MSLEVDYVPATGRHGDVGRYDRVVALTMRERTFRERLIRQVLDQPAGQEAALDIADVGAGTGTLAIMLADAGARVRGVDGDPRILDIARAKPGADGIEWLDGRADSLPLADASVDRVVCSLLLHHLPDEGKRRALLEAGRVLRPGGRLHIADWGPPGDPVMRCAFWVLQRIDGPENTQSLADGALPGMLADAGFDEVRRHDRLRTSWGRLELIAATAGR